MHLSGVDWTWEALRLVNISNIFLCVLLVNTGGMKITMKGCASKKFCVGDVSQALGPTMDMKCCEGNLCNNAQSIGLSLLLLVTSMVSVALFY